MKHPESKLQVSIVVTAIATVLFPPVVAQSPTHAQPGPAATTSDPYIILDGPDLLQARKLEKVRLQKWESRLSQIAAREQATMFYDVRDVGDPPTADYTGQPGGRAMKALALAGAREWKQIHGVQAFSRAGTSVLRDDVNSLLEWLASLSDAEFREVVAGHLRFADLAPDVQKQFDSMITANADMAFVFLDNDDVTLVSLKPELLLSWTDPRTGVSRSLEYLPYSHMRSPHETREPDPIRGKNRSSAIALDKPPRGALDFGKGELLTMHEIVGRAGKAFGASYDVDGRIARANYFVSGSYNRESFDAALEYVSVVPPVRPHAPVKDNSDLIAKVKDAYKRLGPKTIEVAGLRYEMGIRDSRDIDALTAKYGESDQLDTSGFFTQQTLPASQLAGSMPGFAHYLQTSGVTSDTLLSLDYTLILCVSCPGIHTSSVSFFKQNGGPLTPSVMGNMATIQLWTP